MRQIDRFFRQTHSDYRRRFLSNFMNRQPCPTCQGERLCSEARFVTAGGKRLPQILQMNIREAHQWAGSLHFTAEQAQVAEELIKEVRDRLQFMLNVGLHYLTLNRNAPPSLAVSRSAFAWLASWDVVWWVSSMSVFH